VTTSTAALYAMPRNLVLAASAGTGKTHALVGVVLHLLLGGRPGGAVDPSRVVATTFSRKAAAEIRARVTTEVEKLALEPASSFYAQGLRETIGRASDAELSKRAKKALARLPHARFGTLHSFATGVVQRYAVELGLGPGFELAAESETRVRIDDAIARALERRLVSSSDVLRVLAEAAGGIDRLVFALRRILVQLEEDGRPARDLALDESDAATVEREMERLLRHARAVARNPRAAEAASEFLHGWDKQDDARIENGAAALTGLAARGAKTPELEDFFIFRADLPGAPNAEKGRRLARAWRARHAFASHALVVRDILAEAEEEIAAEGKRRAVLGFGEVLRAARELLRDRPDVAEEVASGIEALLVDEFQDTSRVQRDLLQLLWAKERPPAGVVPDLGKLRPSGLLVVGDRKQSIYGFRGADVGVFAELAVGLAGAAARDALGIPPGITWEPNQPIADFHALRQNRRSVEPILAFANAFSAKRFVPGDPPPELFEIDYVPATEDLLVPPEVASAPDAARLAPAAVTWLRITPKAGNSKRLDEALVIADEIPKLKKPYRDIAVLATTNGMLDAVSFALAQADIPYVVAGKSFFRAREISDLAAMLSLVLDPSDRVAMLEVLRGPWTSVHDETLLGLVEPGKGLVPPSRWSNPPTPALVRPEDRDALGKIASLVASLERTAGRLGPGTILREAIAATALENVLARLPRGEQRIANVRKLLTLADRSPDARGFRAWLDDAKEQEVAESEAATFSDEDDAVRLLTIHASKGLDFPIVFVPEIGAPLPRTERNVARVALGAGNQPNVLSTRIADDGGLVVEPPSYLRAHALTQRRERAERQRLAYVAITRAAEQMFFVGGRASDKALNQGSSTLAVLEDMSTELLAVRDVIVPTPTLREAAFEGSGQAVEVPDLRLDPAWSSIPIAPTALADFAHCARRFELVHLLGLPEHARGARSKESETALLDARAQGTLAHKVLERLPVEAFHSPDPSAVTRILTSIGVPADHPQEPAIAARVLRFVGTAYAKSIANARIEREVAFVLPIADEEGRAVTLRGSMDLVVLWPDGAVDVIDYKSARGGDPESYAFQLDIYALAARERYPEAPRLRVGLSFLGAGTGEPVWRSLAPGDVVRSRVAALGAQLITARWRDAFPRVAIEKCEAIHCGFIGRCHPHRES
jgi:ATP-dependent helicase/nuclease subunit A